MPKNSISKFESLSKIKLSLKVDNLVTLFSSILVKIKSVIAIKEIPANIGYIIFQSPSFTTPHAAIIGARKEAIAFINCPKVKVLASLSLDTILDTKGLRETCISVLPIPSNEKAISIDTKL